MKYFLSTFLACIFTLSTVAQEPQTNADIINDEGGTIAISGDVSYTNPLFTRGLSDPLIVLEDQSGFVNRDYSYVIPIESQILGQITSEITASPFTYNLLLPQTPNAPTNDINADGTDDGVQIFQVAFWSNIFGGSYIEERDQYGQGWSGSYSSARVSAASANNDEYIGGKIVIYAEDETIFPAGFGDDAMLFTEDDPLVIIPQGYSVVDMTTTPFTFDRSQRITIDLIESEAAAADDFSTLDYLAAFDAMMQKFRDEYAFTEYKQVDWDALETEFRPIFAKVAQENSSSNYQRALQNFIWRIPDGHLSMTVTNTILRDFFNATNSGIGIAIRELTDGRVIVNYLVEDSPADEAGIQLGTEIISINDQPIHDVISNTMTWGDPFSAPHVERLQQLRYVTRFPEDTVVTMTYRNPTDKEAQTVSLTTIQERESFDASSFNVETTGVELPIQYEKIGDTDILYVEITSFSDDAKLTMQLWERMIEEAQSNNVEGIIIDMRNNGGGRAFVAHQMAAYFFDERLLIGNVSRYDEGTDSFVADPVPDRFIPPEADKRYNGKVAVLVGPNCGSSCEFFSYAMSLQNRAEIIGHYPTAGLGGSIERFFMPDGITVQITTGRAFDADGNIHIEGVGVPPTTLVPVTAESLLNDRDDVLDAAVQFILEN